MDATWSAWLEWSSCSANCKREGESVPTKSRSRICQQEKYGGRGCDFLKNLTKANNQPRMEESQNCTELPKCPTPASLNPWTEWSTCTKTCYEEGTAPPHRNRKRTCRKEVIPDPTLEIAVDTCESLGEVNEKETCEIGFCPGKGSIANPSDEFRYSVHLFHCLHFQLIPSGTAGQPGHHALQHVETLERGGGTEDSLLGGMGLTRHQQVD